jgi:hypothetical protein
MVTFSALRAPARWRHPALALFLGFRGEDGLHIVPIPFLRDDEVR